MGQTKAQKIIKQLAGSVQKQTPIATDMVIPNHSGDNSAGDVLKTPTNDTDIPNKKYVDDKFPVTHASTTGQTTDDHHDKSHAHDGVDGSGRVTHSNVTFKTTDDHHAQDHAAEHEVGGGDLVNHDDLTGFVTNEHTPLESGTSTGQMAYWDSLWKHTETSELFWDDVNKRLGIGVDTPSNSLVFKGDANLIDCIISTNDLLANQIIGLGFSGRNQPPSTPIKSAIAHQRKGIYAQGDMVFLVDDAVTDTSVDISNEVMRLVGSSGNVGIGTDTPAQKLDVNGAAVLDGMTISNDGTKTTFLGKTGDYNRIGDAGVTANGLNSEDDLLITDDLEIKGNTFFGDTVYFADRKQMIFGTSNDFGLSWRTESESFEMITDTTKKSVILTMKGNENKNHDHAAQDNPTMYFQSATSPDTDNTQWMSFAHNQTDGVIGCGKGDIQTGEKMKLTRLGGMAILLTNRTGANSVAGQLVKADTATNDAVILTAIGDTECFGVFLDAGVSDGSEAWVVVSGIADVALDDNVAAVRGNWMATGVAAGYARTSASPAAAPNHFEEIGHCIESVSAGGGGTHILARCVLHFN